ncbi:MAG TPA: bacteriohopanetetrol glucosamine biosynthesis glycosyltransferase HpnI [Candidatus Elarobacter sp.]|nr:bacteriohopanetetrol glucosamine biosynthesis glycosyltransferase HpnI [Candidatus Elarobacter sp.]
MRADPRGVAAGIALGAAVAAIGYTAYATIHVIAFARRVRRARAQAPPRSPSVTVLKPVRGVELGLDENLASFTRQDYPEYSVVLGVLDPQDAALPVLHAVAAASPAPARVVTGDGVARYRNPKMSTLAPMLPYANGHILVIADSDMRVTPDYLRAVVAAFDDPAVGAVTCVYHGEPAAGGVAQQLGAMWITEQFLPSALVARTVEPMSYTFGGTMAVRRDVFDAIGGIDALGPHLADDHALGFLVARSGRRVRLADYVVTATVHDETVAALLQHELRWVRTIRSVRPASYAGIVVSFPLPLAALALVLARNRRNAWVVFAAAAGVRVLLHRALRPLTGGATLPGALIPLRDALGFGVWCAGFFGRTVRWRDQTLAVLSP